MSLEVKWRFDTIFSGNATGDDVLVITESDCRNSCGVCPALQNSTTYCNVKCAKGKERLINIETMAFNITGEAESVKTNGKKRFIFINR